MALSAPWADPNAAPAYQIPMLPNGMPDMQNIDMNALNESIRGYGGKPIVVGGTGTNPTIPGTPPPAADGWGWNPGSFSVGFQGLNSLGNLWMGSQQNKIAKQQLALTKEFGNANLNNSIKSYNTSLDRNAELRYRDPEQIRKYTEENRLSR